MGTTQTYDLYVKSVTGFTRCESCHIPVSYTHLDVYKRQIIDISNASKAYFKFCKTDILYIRGNEIFKCKV